MKLYIATAFLSTPFSQATDSSNPSGSAQKRRDIMRAAILASADPKGHTTASSGFIHAAAKTILIECTPIKKAMELEQEQHLMEDVGMGVLASCADFEYCLEDPSSSLGGRCVPNDQEYVYAVVDSHRMLTQCSGEWTYDCIECTMSDGSAGKKCDGKLACMSGVMGGVGVGGINPNEVPCGSCNGKYACSNAVGPIGEGSCNAEGACYSHRYSVGNNSCNGFMACLTLPPMYPGTPCNVKDNQCNGYHACNDVVVGDIECEAVPSTSPSQSLTSTSTSSSPSTSPTAPPTSSPSASPSSSPSTSPTAPPTSSPSASPSSSPSTLPAAPPTSSPSASPSSSPSTSPTAPTSSISAVAGTGSKFYADWVSGDLTCKSDGEAPQYMVRNPSQWLFDDINTCCAKFFSWKLNACLFGVGASYTGSGKYYPDWEGSNEGCLEDVEPSFAPSYMVQIGAYLYTTLDECCEKHYNYRANECKGLLHAGSNQWFVDWSTFKCVKDCEEANGADCGGLADGFWDLWWTFTTKEECCRKHLSWDFDGCMA